MLTLITATPGSGKTLKAIEVIFKHLNEGRMVYSNIIGLNIAGVIYIQQHPTYIWDWRDLPNGSVVVYDEAHEHPAFNATNLIQDKDKMRQVREIGDSLSLHRHFGFDIYLITQNPRKLDGNVLFQVGCHLHLRRVFGLAAATIYEFPEAQTVLSKSARKDAINNSRWRFPKHLYKFYTSSEVHTHKANIPLKYVLVLLVIFIGFPILVYHKWQQDALFNNNNRQQPQPIRTISPTAPVDSENQSTRTRESSSQPDHEYDLQLLDQENTRIAMVVESSEGCIARNSYGEIINVSQDDCHNYSTRPASMSFSRYKREVLKELPNSNSQVRPEPTGYQVSANGAINPAQTGSSVSYTPANYPDRISTQKVTSNGFENKGLIQ